MHSESHQFRPWRLPLAILVCLLLAGTAFAQRYGTDNGFWGSFVTAVLLLLLWGTVRGLQRSPPASSPQPGTPQTASEPLGTRVRWGLSHSWKFAAFFSVYVLCYSALLPARGSRIGGFPLWGVVACYWLAAVLAGALLGLAKPLTRFRFGSFLVGALVATSVYGGFGILFAGSLGVGLFAGLILGTIVGGGIGLVEFDEHR